MLIVELLLVFAGGFAGGWAFFKHRQDLKDKARAEINAAVSKLGSH